MDHVALGPPLLVLTLLRLPSYLFVLINPIKVYTDLYFGALCRNQNQPPFSVHLIHVLVNLSKDCDSAGIVWVGSVRISCKDTIG
jgi:hypothetical protein